MRPKHPHAAESGVGKHIARESESAKACAAGKERVANAHPHKLAPEASKLPGPFLFSPAAGLLPPCERADPAQGFAMLVLRAMSSLIASGMILTFAVGSLRAAEGPANAGLRLWSGDAPGALGSQPDDIPTLTPLLPAIAARNGASILILPGGGYQRLADHEGIGYAEWFASQGFTTYVLKYRLGPRYHHPTMFHDVTRALRMVRAFAKRDGLDPARIAIIGSSAGGHLAATLATHFDGGNPAATDPIERESSRPDLAILCYPVVTMGKFAHAGSKLNLLGATPAAELVSDTSPELHVTAQTPPCFLWSTYEDQSVPIENTLMFASALRRAGVPFSLHIYEKGVHGAGLGIPTRAAPPWPADLLYWLHERKFLP
jgi:acetyl esterase/lipase